MSAAVILLVLAVLLVAAASAIEVILFALTLARVSQLEAEGARGARALASLRARPAGLLATTWIVRVAGAAVAALAAWDAARSIAAEGWWAGVAAVLVAIALVVLAEFAGKSVAQRAAERACLRAAGPVWIISQALLPVTWPAELIVRALAPKFTEILPGISDREIRDLVSPGNGDAVIEEHERRLIERTFLLDQTTAYDIMTPRVDMFAWPDTRTLAEIAPELRAARYSRVPLYSQSIDQITGVLYVRDAYQALISGQRDVELRALAREPFFVPGSVTLDKLLLDFQAHRIHMGIVIDEYGGVDGLIALEDILEELVGEIVDESDVAEEPIVRLSRNEILVDGSADLREINHFFNTSFPLLEHRSLNGYLLDVFGQVPETGERISREGVVIEVTAATDTQVLRARISRKSA
ncbi:MAG: HlyC/CorC family transporter [Gemmatimonadota bacterium]|nr:MAG: HlyC/CorC family transporter [Gemmatimonadota bacterium]